MMTHSAAFAAQAQNNLPFLLLAELAHAGEGIGGAMLSLIQERSGTLAIRLQSTGSMCI